MNAVLPTLFNFFHSYFKVLVQEMDVRVDKGFLMALIDLFSSEETRGKEASQYFYFHPVVISY